MDWVEGGSLIANPPWEDDTKTGAYGAGSLATMKRGKFGLILQSRKKLITSKKFTSNTVCEVKNANHEFNILGFN